MIIRNLYLFLILAFLSCTIFSCKNKPAGQQMVSVSILPQKYLVERIAGDYVQVNVMVPPGMSPATCDLSTDQLRKLYDSKLCFTIGYLPFEITHLYPVLANRSDIKTYNHSSDIQLVSGSCGHHHGEEHGGHEHGVDPHIWMSPAHTKTMAATICRVLSETYPEQSQKFEANYELLAYDIDSVAAKAAQVLEAKQHKSFLIYHPALTYFANDYGMEQISIEDEGKEPNPAHLKKIIDTAKEKGIHIIFIQQQFDANNAEAIARQIGAKVIQIDPLGENWLKEMGQLIDIFKIHLN